jgi:hypothetical protein
MTTTLRPLSETARVFHEVCRITRELELLKTYLEDLLSKERESAPPPAKELIDPRTRRPWRSGRKRSEVLP